MPEKAEFTAELTYDDGAAFDVGTERGLAASLNAYIDYKSAHQSPAFDSNPAFAMPNWSGEFRVLYVFPLFVGFDHNSTTINRSLIVAPWFWSSDGVSSQLRITISRSLPIPRPSNTGLNFQTPRFTDLYSQATWTTSSTTQVTGSDASLSLGTKGIFYGHLFMTIEIDRRNAGFTGLAKCIEGPRTGTF